MYTTKLIIIGFSLILIGVGLAVWANTTVLNLDQKIKDQRNLPAGRQVNSFEECVNAGYPVQESFPRKCSVPKGPSFTEEVVPTEEPTSTPTLERFQPGSNPDTSSGDLCVNKCGDNFCAIFVCQGSNCPCAETANSCPQDCQ